MRVAGAPLNTTAQTADVAQAEADANADAAQAQAQADADAQAQTQQTAAQQPLGARVPLYRGAVRFGPFGPVPVPVAYGPAPLYPYGPSRLVRTYVNGQPTATTTTAAPVPAPAQDGAMAEEQPIPAEEAQIVEETPVVQEGVQQTAPAPVAQTSTTSSRIYRTGPVVAPLARTVVTPFGPRVVRPVGPFGPIVGPRPLGPVSNIK